MVMHARKIPRLNDGYYDRGQSHSYEDKSSSKNRHYNDRFGDQKRDSSSYRHSGGGSGDSRGSRDRNDSPAGRTSPRYQNKSSYVDRNKDHASRGNSIDQRSSQDRSRGNKDGRNREQKQQDHRAEVRKAAMRVCGDWSEHISSKGKCYYYNCKTEESKWEKPKEWTLADDTRQKESKERKVAHSSKKVHEEKPKHSSSTSLGASDRHRAEQQYNSRPSASFGSPAASSRHLSQDSMAHHMAPPSSRSSTEQKYHSRQTHNSSASNNGGQCSSSYLGHRTSSQGHLSHSNTWHGPEQSKTMEGLPPSVERTITPDRPSHGYDRHHKLNSGSNTAVSWHTLSGYKTSFGHKSDYNGAKHLRNDNEDSRQAEDMDISPGSTPTEEAIERQISMAMAHGAIPHAVSSISTPPTSHKPSIASMLATLTNLTSSSGMTASDLPALANLSALNSLVSTSPGGSSTSPGSALPQMLQQLTGSTRASAQPSQTQASKQQVLQQAIQVLQKLQQNMVVQQKQQQQRQLQQLLVTQLHQLQTQLQHQQQHHQQQQHLRPTSHHSSTHHTHGHKMSVDEASQSPYSPPDESDGTPLQSPEYNNTAHHHHHHHSEETVTPTTTRTHTATGRESPRSDHSVKSSRRESPTHSHTSSQNLSSVGTSQLSAAHRKEDSIHLTPSLANYYDESLIGHVSGLIYDSSERQSDCVAKDVHAIGTELSSRVAVDLKGARSLVRVGEIISTLHEQRILFIRQQIKDLDGWRTHNTFMPSTSSSQPPPSGAT